MNTTHETDHEILERELPGHDTMSLQTSWILDLFPNGHVINSRVSGEHIAICATGYGRQYAGKGDTPEDAIANLVVRIIQARKA